MLLGVARSQVPRRTSLQIQARIKAARRAVNVSGNNYSQKFKLRNWRNFAFANPILVQTNGSNLVDPFASGGIYKELHFSDFTLISKLEKHTYFLASATKKLVNREKRKEGSANSFKIAACYRALGSLQSNQAIHRGVSIR